MMNRRHFLKGIGASALTLGFDPRELFAQSTSEPILVAVFQRGAVDGLNMVIPFTEPEYYRLRPRIAIPAPMGNSEDRALDLDGLFGLHPAMRPLHPLFGDGRLAIVHAAGSPDPSRSHFEAQDYMAAATPGVKSTRDGWMNRYLRTIEIPDDVPFAGMSIGRNLPRSLAGRASTLSAGSVAEMRLAGPQRFYKDAFDDGVGDIVTKSAAELFDGLDFLAARLPERRDVSLDYPPGRLPAALANVAQLIKADVGLRTAFVEIGGWDHHAAEGGVRGQLANRLREFSGGIRAFYEDLGDRVDNVVIVTMSEFGRTVKENGNAGTDHGHGNAMLVLGARVQGGKVYGEWPGLAAEQLFEGRDLAVKTDFRDVLADVLTGHMKARDLSPVFPDFVPGGLGLMG